MDGNKHSFTHKQTDRQTVCTHTHTHTHTQGMVCVLEPGILQILLSLYEVSVNDVVQQLDGTSLPWSLDHLSIPAPLQSPSFFGP